MKKAAIVTLYGNGNYGNKLQNYAVQEILKGKGMDVETIINTPVYNNKKINIENLLKYKIKCFWYFITKGDKEKYFFKHCDSKIKKRNYLSFNKYINVTDNIFSFKKIQKFENYDYYFVGSDQIWNPECGGLSDFSLLTFTSAKKISLSASFGIYKIDSKYNEKIKSNLNNFDAISVREFQGRDIINSIIPDKEVSVLIDPTLMLSSEQWDVVAKKPNNYNNEKYLLCYFLGGISSEREKIIYEIANKKNLKIINLLNKNDFFYESGPSEFLFLEKNAQIILTDSFHSSVFAFINNVPFVVFDREGKNNKMGSRIDTLLYTFMIEDRKFNKNKNFEEYFLYNYEDAYKILKEKQKDFNSFIDKNIL